jgi:hypothetical protein
VWNMAPSANTCLPGRTRLKFCSPKTRQTLAGYMGSTLPRAVVKDAFHEFVVNGRFEAISPEQNGTKCAPHFVFTLQAG